MIPLQGPKLYTHTYFLQLRLNRYKIYTSTNINNMAILSEVGSGNVSIAQNTKILTFVRTKFMTVGLRKDDNSQHLEVKQEVCRTNIRF
jgi:hypothetical protein